MGLLGSILSDFEKYLGLAPIEGRNENQGWWLMQISNTNEVWVKDLNPGIYMRGTIGPTIGPGNHEDFFMYLMKANYLGQGTGGSIISIDPSEKFLTLALCIPYEINYKIFRDKLEDFLNYLEYWREEIKNYEARQV